MRVPGSMPSDARISEGMTNCPLVLTDVIRRSMSYIMREVRTKPG